jgi:alpha-glucosidase (family GH31 glycosyl hydrolase)
MQGGTAAVLGNLSALETLGCPISAFWLQDWSGVRQLSMRQGLWWNWRWSDAHYPGHEQMISTLANKSIRVLTYLNPMLADCGADSNCSGGVNLYRVALAAGFLVRHGPANELWSGYNGAAMVDLTNPAAAAWFAEDVVTAAYRTGIRGFMADFGEAFPLDANMTHTTPSTSTAAEAHNAFPDRWFAVARAGTELANVSASDSFFFGRSAWLSSAALYSSGWQGDQLCSWDADDGLASAVASLLAAGVSGMPFTHSDIGGYNAYTPLGIRRTAELFYRWCELAAFTTTMRTHDGSDPHANWQFYSSDASRREFTRSVKIYRALAPLRAFLVREAEATGLPIARPVLLQFPKDDAAIFGNMTNQFVLGRVVVAPVTVPNRTSWQVVLPVATVDCWASLWDPRGSNSFSVTPAQRSAGRATITVRAPVGCPPAWFPCSDEAALRVARALEVDGMADRCRAA